MSLPNPRRTVLLTFLTLLAFAGNSILCRLALQDGSIDPISFTALRLASGALALRRAVGIVCALTLGGVALAVCARRTVRRLPHA
jgi:hypothetical protein